MVERPSDQRGHIGGRAERLLLPTTVYNALAPKKCPQEDATMAPRRIHDAPRARDRKGVDIDSCGRGTRSSWNPLLVDFRFLLFLLPSRAPAVQAL
eukprot:4819263-Pyramimonas_sp.AAC.1